MIGDRVKKIRKEKKLSMTELAEKAGVAKSYLSSLERNIQVNPSVQFLEKIAAVLHVPLNALLHDEPDMNYLDEDWAELVKEAMQSGVSKNQFKEFIEFNKWRTNKEEE
jgi:XRE family transcriptional regulator of biofilm formation